MFFIALTRVKSKVILKNTAGLTLVPLMISSNVQVITKLHDYYEWWKFSAIWGAWMVSKKSMDLGRALNGQSTHIGLDLTQYPHK